MSGDRQTPYCTLTKHDAQETPVCETIICSDLSFLMGTSIFHGLPETQPLLRSWQSFSWPSILDSETAYSLLIHNKRLKPRLLWSLWISRCGRRKNRITTAEAEGTDDHHARSTMQHNQAVNFALWQTNKSSNDCWGWRNRWSLCS